MTVRSAHPDRGWTFRVRCLYCGHDGPMLQRGPGSVPFRCPACAGDLYARPPRSYRELEGLTDTSPAATRPEQTTLAMVRGALFGVGAVVALSVMWCWWSLRHRLRKTPDAAPTARVRHHAGRGAAWGRASSVGRIKP